MNKYLSDLELILKESQDSQRILCAKKIFITGGTGFFGKWLLEALIHINKQEQNQENKIEVSVLSRNPESFKNKNPALCEGITFLKGDIETFEFPAEDFDYIIHAATAASATLNQEQPMYMLTSIINGTQRVLEFAKKANVKKILFTSSGAVYGKQGDLVEKIQESDMSAPDVSNSLSAYGEGKRVSELLGNIFFKETGIEFVSARCFAFSGKHLPLDGTFAFGNFLNNKIKNENILIKGDGTPRRSYLYGADLVIWLLKVLTHGKAGESYNVGSDQDVSIEELAQAMVKGNEGIKVEVLIKEKAKKIARYVPSIKKAQDELGLKVYTSLDRSIQKSIV